MQSEYPDSAAVSAQASHVQKLKDLEHIQDQVTSAALLHRIHAGLTPHLLLDTRYTVNATSQVQEAVSQQIVQLHTAWASQQAVT